MNDFQSIETTIEALLASDDGKSQVAGRQKQIAAVARALSALKGNRNSATWSLRGRKGVWFSTTQSQAIAANAQRCRLSVQMSGREIGKLDICPKETDRYQFRPNEAFEPSGVIWAWSRNAKDASEIRKFLDQRRNEWKDRRALEREIQWQLAKWLWGDKKKDSVTRGMQPVRWFGFPTEIGVSVNRGGKLATGTIDLLVRRNAGQQGGQFLVFEVKRPGERCVEPALMQAVYYSMALSHEANEDPQTRHTYRTAFGSKGDASLKFGAVVAMHDTEEKGHAEHCQKAIEKMHASLSASTIVDRLGVLLYKWNEQKQKITGLKWLEGWDARHPTPQSVASATDCA